jgi:uncharacterized protein (DUF427 family)
MSLLMPGGPLDPRAGDAANYRVEGPARRLFLQQFPRQLRAELGGEVVLDTVGAALLFETGEHPTVYVPAGDVRHLSKDGDRSEHLPGKGRARFYPLRAGDRELADAVWQIVEPEPEVRWLATWLGVRWDAMDAWYDEDERVSGGLTDPFHRVDVRRSRRRLRVVRGGEPLAESAEPRVVSETGLPNRFYLPPGDVRVDALTPSPTSSVCPYKGRAEYAGVGDEADVAWRYPEPLAGAAAIAGMWCFDETKVDVQVDTRTQPWVPRQRDARPPADPLKRLREKLRRHVWHPHVRFF